MTVPPFAKAGSSLASFSRLLSRRGHSSAVTVPPLTSTARSSPAKAPASCAAIAFRWLASANRSCASRPIFPSTARFSAVWPSESVWPIFSSRGLVHRHPSAVS